MKDKKIGFGDVSTSIKIAVITGWVVAFLFVISFILGFISGFLGGI